MGFERRLFARTDVEIQGTLRWAVKRRIGGIKQHDVPMMTIDLSVNGAKILVAEAIDLPVGASCRIMFSDESSPARVRKVTTNGSDHKMLSMELEEPPIGFMRVIDQWLDASAGGRKFEETSWFSMGSSTTSAPTRPARR